MRVFGLLAMMLIVGATIGCETNHQNTDRRSLSGIGGYGPASSGGGSYGSSDNSRTLGMSSGHNVRLTGGDSIRNRFRQDPPKRDVTDEFFDDIDRGLKKTGDFLFGWID